MPSLESLTVKKSYQAFKSLRQLWAVTSEQLVTHLEKLNSIAEPMMPGISRDLKDGGQGGNKRERRREDSGKTQRVAFPLILWKNPTLAWGLGVPGMPMDLGWERTYGATELLRSPGCCALKEQTVLWGEVFTGKESLNKVTSVFNKFLLTCCDVSGNMLRRVLNMMDKVPTHMELTL